MAMTSDCPSTPGAPKLTRCEPSLLGRPLDHGEDLIPVLDRIFQALEHYHSHTIAKRRT